jgi:hypothetical protein
VVHRGTSKSHFGFRQRWHRSRGGKVIKVSGQPIECNCACLDKECKNYQKISELQIYLNLIKIKWSVELLICYYQ